MGERVEISAEAAEARKEQIRRVEVGLSYLLRGGVVISAVLVLAGLGIMYAHHPEYLSAGAGVSAAEKVMREMAFPHHVRDVWEGLLRGEGRAVVIVGLFVLIATPVMRVAVSVVVFFHLRDKVFVGITLVVLAVLMASFVVGRAGG